MTAFVALATARSGSADSAAAMVTISAPTKAKMTTTMPERTVMPPCGKNPPCAVRLLSPGESPLPSPSSQPTPIRMKRRIAATLMEANQNSNSPNDRTDHRFVAVSAVMRMRLRSHIGMPGIQLRMISAPATASTARTMAQKYQ
jgi:hypothetical protein